MMWLLNFVYFLLLCCASPWLIYASLRYGKYREGLAEKFLGRVPSLLPTNKRIWFHAVSVGEVNLLTALLKRIIHEEPNTEIVITTTTKTGYGLAQKRFAGNRAGREIVVSYCPLDFSWAVRNAFDRLKPDLLVLVELELWPNLLATAGKRQIPVAIVNGRLSEKSTRGYMRLGPLVRSWLRPVSLVAAQSPACAKRFEQIGRSGESNSMYWVHEV